MGLKDLLGLPVRRIIVPSTSPWNDAEEKDKYEPGLRRLLNFAGGWYHEQLASTFSSLGNLKVSREQPILRNQRYFEDPDWSSEFDSSLRFYNIGRCTSYSQDLACLGLSISYLMGNSSLITGSAMALTMIKAGFNVLSFIGDEVTYRIYKHSLQNKNIEGTT